MSIRILPPHVALRIAAGEVITRPVDVVKELVENALDAGARHIQVGLARGGLDLISVRDDGCGIPAGEAALAFERHATSKLEAADDLQRIGTLGFRGEALPSIAAVSQVVLTTRSAGETAGTEIALDAGKVQHVRQRAWPGGSMVAARSLFYNAPARMRFLHSAVAESGRVARLVKRFALAYPDVTFVLREDEEAIFESAGLGDRRELVARLLGPQVARALLDVALLADGVSVSGLASPATLGRATRSHQYVFVNGRLVQSRVLQQAVDTAYRNVLPGGQHPIVVLDLRVSPDEVDVNVHPQKLEMRFQRERLVFARVLEALRAALAEGTGQVKELGGLAPSAELPETEDAAAQAAFAWRAAPPAAPELPDAPVSDGLPPLRVLGQIGSVFVVCEGPRGLYLVDQHRAHERIIFDRLLAQPEGAGQVLLEPEVVELGPTQVAALPEVQAELQRLGFEIEPFGPQSLLVRAVPAALSSGRVGPALAEALEVSVGAGDLAAWRERASAALA